MTHSWCFEELEFHISLLYPFTTAKTKSEKPLEAFEYEVTEIITLQCIVRLLANYTYTQADINV